MQASLPLEMLRSWDFLDHGDERIKPILCHPEQGPVNSSLRDITLCHPELVSESSHRKTLGNTQNEKVVARSMGQMLKRVQHDKKRKAAFTLAEVLITLGIIGVVAALTLPTLISNYQKRVYVTQLKKSVSVLSNGFKLMMGHEGVTELRETVAFSYSGYLALADINYDSPIESAKPHVLALKEGLVRVFPGIQFTSCDAAQVKYLNGDNAASGYNKGAGSNSTCIKFPDGSEIYRYTFYSTTQPRSYYAELYIDVNGPKNPNTIGRDIFVLYLLNNGTVVGGGSQIVSELVYGDPNSVYWRTATGMNATRMGCTTDSYGMGCAGRVLEEDAMNY